MREDRTICAALQNAVYKNLCNLFSFLLYLHANLLFIHSHMHVSVEAVEAYEKCACEFPAQAVVVVVSQGGTRSTKRRKTISDTFLAVA